MSKISNNDDASTSVILPFLPPELWVQIIQQIPSAGTLANLAQTNHALHSFVENEGWRTFSRVRFPSLYASITQRFNEPSKKEPGELTSGDGARLARTLTTASRAWDRRALVARSIAVPDTDAANGGSRVDGVRSSVRVYGDSVRNAVPQPALRDSRNGGRQQQTMGFVPRIDVREAGNIGGHRTEILAWSTGATVCLRERERKNGYGSGKDTFSVWKPIGAKEGRDDITALHLLPTGRSQADGTEGHAMIVGTANGDLQQVEIPRADTTSGKANVISLSTAKLPVRGSSVYHGADGVTSLIVGLGDSQISLYSLEPTLDNTSIEPLSQIDVSKDSSSIVSAMSSMNISTSKRIWHTNFLSATTVAVGLGPSQAPVEIYTIQGSGILQSPLRTFRIFRTDDEARIDLPTQGTAASKPFLSSVYTIVPLPGSSASSSDLGGNSNGDVFLSGAYDGLIRLHDLRSNRDHVQMYSDAAGGGGNDSPIYSLLTRGLERVLAGTGRHNLLKVFDLRMGARCYDYLDAQTHHQPDKSSFGAASKTFSSGSESFNLFLRENSGGITGASSPAPQTQNVHRGGRRPPQNRRPAPDSSIYTLVASDACSPYIYAGVENQIVSLALHAVSDIHPDTAYFEAPRALDEDLWWRGAVDGLGGGSSQQQPQRQESEIMNLSMYEQDLGMKLCVQRSVGDARRVQAVALANPGVFGEVASGSSSNRGVRKDGWLTGRTVFGGLDERWMDAADADGGRWQRGLAQ